MVKNINSKESLNDNVKMITLANSGMMAGLLDKIPVYLVDEETMDKLYPPRRRYLLEPECVQGFLREINEIDSFDEFIEAVRDLGKLERCLQESKTFVAMGVYLPGLNEEERDILQCQNGKAITICPERIISFTEKICKKYSFIPFDFAKDVIIAEVILHEFAHAFMDGGKSKNLPHERLIEESLANAIVYSNMANNLEFKAVITASMESQPFEYRQYKYWVSDCRINITGIVNYWREKRVFYNEIIHNELSNFSFETFRRLRNFLLKHVYRYEYNNIEIANIFWNIIALNIMETSVKMAILFEI